MHINIFIQARMSSSRYPGKVLAPFNSRPIISHILNTARKIKNVKKVCVLTSTHVSDDPLVAYLDKCGVDYVRGELDNVFERFMLGLDQYPCDYFVRLCADSPGLDQRLLQKMIDLVGEEFDIVTNIFPRKYPKGQSVEIIKKDVFEKIDITTLSQRNAEHVTSWFYERADRFRIKSVTNAVDMSHINQSVDTIQDLKVLEKLVKEGGFTPDELEVVC